MISLLHIIVIIASMNMNVEMVLMKQTDMLLHIMIFLDPFTLVMVSGEMFSKNSLEWMQFSCMFFSGRQMLYYRYDDMGFLARKEG